VTVLALFGPTASGKSAVARALAELVDGEAVSADSAQVYRALPILTNQDDPAPRLAAIWPLSHEASVAEYQRLAHAAIDELLAAGRVPVVVGGTGLYLRAALTALEHPPAPEPGARERWAALYDKEGAERAHGLLAERDPEAAARVHPNDRRRVVRALELVEAGSSLAGNGLWSGEWRLPTLVVGLEVPREELARRIEARTREMFERGVEQEVRAALREPLSETARKVLGLREVEELPREQAIERMVVRTRRFAAYQRKWMRRIPGLVTVRADRPPEETAADIVDLARARQRLPRRRAS
jgi:tRNA dimethylallyltransferase